MHEELYSIITTNIPTEFLNPQNLQNVFPQHIVNGAISNQFSSALAYNVISTEVNHVQKLWHVQLSVYNLSYSECQRIVGLLEALFNKKDFSGDANSWITSTVEGTFEIPFDTDTALYGVALNVTIKTRIA